MRKVRFSFQDDSTSFPEYMGELVHRNLTEEEEEQLHELIIKWCKHDTVTIEIDLDADSFRIVPLDELYPLTDYKNSYPFVSEENRTEPEFEAWEE